MGLIKGRGCAVGEVPLGGEGGTCAPRAALQRVAVRQRAAHRSARPPAPPRAPPQANRLPSSACVPCSVDVQERGVRPQPVWREYAVPSRRASGQGWQLRHRVQQAARLEEHRPAHRALPELERYPLARSLTPVCVPPPFPPPPPPTPPHPTPSSCAVLHRLPGGVLVQLPQAAGHAGRRRAAAARPERPAAGRKRAPQGRRRGEALSGGGQRTGDRRAVVTRGGGGMPRWHPCAAAPRRRCRGAAPPSPAC